MRWGLSIIPAVHAQLENQSLHIVGLCKVRCKLCMRSTRKFGELLIQRRQVSARASLYPPFDFIIDGTDLCTQVSGRLTNRQSAAPHFNEVVVPSVGRKEVFRLITAFQLSSTGQYKAASGKTFYEQPYSVCAALLPSTAGSSWRAMQACIHKSDDGTIAVSYSFTKSKSPWTVKTGECKLNPNSPFIPVSFNCFRRRYVTAN